MAHTLCFHYKDGIRGGKHALLAVDSLTGPGSLVRLAHVTYCDHTVAVFTCRGNPRLGWDVAPVKTPVDEWHGVANSAAGYVNSLSFNGIYNIRRRVSDGWRGASNLVRFVLAVEFSITVETLWNALVSRKALVLSDATWRPRNTLPAVVLICAISAVVVSVTEVHLEDAFLVLTLHLVGLT